MQLPKCTDVPFFCYGVFKPGQLGFLQLGDYVERIVHGASIQGTLLERDGFPLISPDGQERVKGHLLLFSILPKPHTNAFVQWSPRTITTGTTLLSRR